MSVKASRGGLLGLIVAVMGLGYWLSRPAPPPENELSPTPQPTPRKSAAEPVLSASDFTRAQELPGYVEVLKLKLPPPENQELGRELYRNNCADCHGTEGHGNGTNTIRLSPRPTNVTRVSLFKYGSEERGIFRTIKYGVPQTGMAPWEDRMTDSEIWATTRFVRSLQVNQ